MSGLHILLIDDEVDFTETLAERLELRGFKAEIAGNGEAGLALIRKNEYDIVILDLKMPGLSGIETLKEIRNIHPDLPVILLTGHGSTKGGDEGVDLGANDYMMKPINIDEFIQKVKSTVKK